MKLILFIFILISVDLKAQSTLYLSFQPIDLGIGLRYDYQKNIGSYASITSGSYRLGESYIKNHIKMSSGVIINKFTLGISYNKYSGVKGINERALKPLSFEVGTKGSSGRLSSGIRFDLLKREVACDVGLKL